jgi:hypothetical protein
MIFIGPHVFEFYEGKNKILKLKQATKEELGPFRTCKAGGLSFSPSIFKAYRNEVLQSMLTVTKKVNNEDYFISGKTVNILEKLAKAYKFASLIAWFKRYREKLDNISLENNLSAEAKNRPLMENDNNKKIRELKDEIELTNEWPELKIAKINYLKKEKTNLSSCLDKLNNYIQQLQDRETESWLIETFKDVTDYQKIDGKVRSLNISIDFIKDKYKGNKIVVTDEMIEAAKKVPFNKLIKLEVVGNRAKALCPFHNEKTPSFIVYGDTNRGHCHGCGKNVDTIQFLVETKGMDFNQAVLTLLKY